MTHLLHAHDFQVHILSLTPSPTALWTFPLGHPWGTIKSKSPSQLLFLLSLSQLVALFSTQGPKLQPREPSLTSASHLILYLVNSIPLSSSPLPGSRSSFFPSWTFTATFNTLGLLAESHPHYIRPLSTPQRDDVEEATPHLPISKAPSIWRL